MKFGFSLQIRRGGKKMEFPNWSLNDKVAIVTGASRGLGRAIALAYANAGADVVLASRDEVRLKEVSAEISQMGRKALHKRTNITKEGEVIDLVKAAFDEFGKIDILVNNAGTIVRKNAVDISTSEWDTVLDTNLKGAFWCCREAGKIMIAQRSGKVINIASAWATQARAGILPYPVSKAAVYHMTKALAIEWAQHNINVNCIVPGWFETELTAPLKNNPEMLRKIEDNTPLGRMGKPEELTGAAIFLASDASNFATGSCLCVDGGWSIGWTAK
jgi:2-deoxy-D-gluconate 3-dehydrogenase